MFEKIPANVPEDSVECSRRFRGMFQKILENFPEDSVEDWRGLLGMLSKILENDQKNSEIIMTGNYIRKIRISHIS